MPCRWTGSGEGQTRGLDQGTKVWEIENMKLVLNFLNQFHSLGLKIGLRCKLKVKKCMLFKARAFEHLVAARANFGVEQDEREKGERNELDDFIDLVSPLFTFPWRGLFIHARRLLVGQKRPYNYYLFGEYSPPPWACSPFGGPVCLG